MESILKDKSYLFALRFVKLVEYLNADKQEYVPGKQILRSGTVIGVLISEAGFAQSRSGFLMK